jgi:predicted membrane GTPase involved in stress response
MSAPRLILKHPTGWFAAGREFAQAMTLISDGAFKLYVHVCLSANRRTGRMVTSRNELARAVKQSLERVATALVELEERGVCAVAGNGNANLALEIGDRFWPYQKQPGPGCTRGAETEFVGKVRALFLAPACVQASFSAADEKIAVQLHRRGVQLEQMARAILLGSARKYVSMINAGAQTPITSLQYFADVIDEVIRSPIPESYWEPLRAKVTRMEKQWLQAHAANP